MKQSMIMQTFSAFWQQRDARERRFLSALIILISIALVYALFINPALNNSSNLGKNIPKLRQQVSEMANLAGQYAQVSAAMTENIAPPTREVLEASLSRRGIKTQSLTVSDEIVRLQVNAVAYSNIMEWLLEMQKAARLTVDEAKVTALPEAGQVSLVLTLRQQKGAP